MIFARLADFVRARALADKAWELGVIRKASSSALINCRRQRSRGDMQEAQAERSGQSQYGSQAGSFARDRDLRLRCKRIGGNLEVIVREQDPLIVDPKTTMDELVPCQP